MTSAVRAARLLAWITATVCVLVFAGLVRRVVRDWRIAMMPALRLARFHAGTGHGVGCHAILRGELTAACTRRSIAEAEHAPADTGLPRTAGDASELPM